MNAAVVQVPCSLYPVRLTEKSCNRTVGLFAVQRFFLRGMVPDLGLSRRWLAIQDVGKYQPDGERTPEDESKESENWNVHEPGACPGMDNDRRPHNDSSDDDTHGYSSRSLVQLQESLMDATVFYLDLQPAFPERSRQLPDVSRQIAEESEEFKRSLEDLLADESGSILLHYQLLDKRFCGSDSIEIWIEVSTHTLETDKGLSHEDEVRRHVYPELLNEFHGIVHDGDKTNSLSGESVLAVEKERCLPLKMRSVQVFRERVHVQQYIRDDLSFFAYGR